MAKKILTNLDLFQNSIYRLRIENLAVAPSTPVKGQIYYDTAENTFKGWNGSWQDLGSMGGRTQEEIEDFVAGMTSGTAPIVVTYDDEANTITISHIATAGNKHIPAGGSVGEVLRNSAAGTAIWDTENVYTLPIAANGVLGGITADPAGDINIDGTGKVTLKTSYATQQDIIDAIADLVGGGAVELLNTLEELGNALGDDPNFATTITNLISAKPSKSTVVMGDNSATTFVLNHALNSRDLVVLIREVASPYAEVMADVEMTDTNNITVRFSVAPTASEFTATIIG
jgi:hypothetical protein